MRKILATFAAPLAHGLRMAANLVILKLIAVSVGPVGMGVLGNFMSLTTMMSIFAGGGISSGVTKYTAEYRESPKRLVDFLGSAFAFGAFFSAIVLVLSILFCKEISLILFKSEEFYWIILTVGIFQIFCFFGTFVVAVANGLGRQDIFAIITLVGYGIAMLIAWLLITYYKIPGAAVSLLVVASATALPALYFALRSKLMRLCRIHIRSADARRLIQFSFMALVSAIIFPSAEIFVRSSIIDSLGATQAGYWQAMIRLSGAYIGLFTLYMSINYMPILSAEFNRSKIVAIIQRQLLLIVFGYALFSFAFYFSRNQIISMLYSSDFAPIAELLIWYLLGDLFRLVAYVIGFLGVAKAAWRFYVLCETLQAGLLVLLASCVLMIDGDLIALARAYASGYLIYLLFMLFVFSKYKNAEYDFFR